MLRRRRKLSFLYQEALYRAAKIYLESGDQDNAIDMYCRLIEQDEYDEVIYKRLANLILR